MRSNNECRVTFYDFCFCRGSRNRHSDRIRPRVGSPALSYFLSRIPLVAIASRLYGGIDNYTLLALPFFILAGNLMNHTGITKDLVNLARLLVGRVRGALAQVNIVVSIIFAGLTGAAVADTAAIGSILVPAMIEEGYSPEYSAAVTATSSIIGPIIPQALSWSSTHL